MPHDVFISYSSKDKTTADAVCGTLEAQGVRCWIAPRDVIHGREWSECIVGALQVCPVMVLVFSSHANASPQVRREVQLAFECGVTVIPLRVENVVPVDSLKYYLGPVHWLDALSPPLDRFLQQLTVTVKTLLAARADRGPPPPVPVPLPTPVPPPPPHPLPVARPVTARVIVCGLIAAFTLVSGLINFLRAQNPAVGTDEFSLYAGFPTVRSANLVANALNAALATAILLGCWRVHHGHVRSARVVRMAAGVMFGVSGLWMIWVLAGTTLGANWVHVPPDARSALVSATVLFGLFAMTLAGAVWAMFRKGE